MSQHHRAHWSAEQSKLWRKRIEPQLPLPCVDCGRPVYPEMKWQVGHITPLSQGGTATADNLGPTHTKAPGQKACNQIAGGRMGAAVTNRNRQTKQAKSNRWFEL